MVRSEVSKKRKKKGRYPIIYILVCHKIIQTSCTGEYHVDKWVWPPVVTCLTLRARIGRAAN